MMLPSGNDAATALAEWGGKYLIKANTNTSSNLNSG
jgi:D-alanyl-D-alanine carboxypeptidase